MTTHHVHELYSESRTAVPRLLTVNQVAEVLGISRATVYKLVRQGQLRAVRAGERLRFRVDELNRYLERDGDGVP